MLKKLVGKYNNMSVEMKAVAWFTICGILQKCISFFTTPLFTRLLTEEQYGQVTVYNSWVDLLTVVITLNLFYGSLNTAMVKFEEDRDKYISTVCSLILCLVSCAFVIFRLLDNYIGKWLNLSDALLTVMLIQIFFQSITNMWMSRKRFEYKYVSVIVVTLGIFALSPILSILAILNTTYKAETRIMVHAGVYVVFGIFILVDIYRKGKSFFSAQYWGYAFKFNLPLVPHYLSTTILGQSDRIMIERMIGAGTAAIYSVAYSLSMALSIVTTSVNQAFTPWLYRRLKNKEYDKIPQTVYQLIAVAATLLVVLMLFGPEAIAFLAPESYATATWAIPPIAASILFTFIYQLFANIEFYYEKSNYIMFASIGSACLNLVLNYIFIPRFGFLAAAYTTLVCYIVFSLTHYMFAKHVMAVQGIEWNFRLTHILRIAFVFLLAMAVVLVLYSNNLIRYAVILLIGIVVFVKRKTLMVTVRQIVQLKNGDKGEK